ncbi:MarR family winged helix-turn-helix transcriptional regulator [Cohnella nanjingensis]|uniref:MarR family transcriptional regulator n=1 Tax=Cohnella nanjingensis TaxID=1387779 RepID=A0A7X0RMY3_9BACL|nr:MarR family transcriptional regulator [Cohnella nanjingensis]MBB6670430.1 MarR family transcriptional regulator [Cohnella nanjingensis]
MEKETKTESWQWDQGPIGRLVKTGYITLRREVEDMLRPTGLTHTQWSALGVIRHYPGITSSQLEHILMIERPSVTSLMNGLANRGLIIRKDHPQDGRFKQIYLTEAGMEQAHATEHFAAEVEGRVREGMTAAEFETLRQLLVKMVSVFDKT